MDREEVLAAYDEQVRRAARSAAYSIEREDAVVREVREHWAGVIWSDLDEQTAGAAIAAQIERFRGHRGRWEWTLYSYDRPADLARRLEVAGFVAEDEESLLVAEIAALDLHVSLPPGVEIVEVRDEPAVRALVAMQDEVFGSGHPGMAEALLLALSRRPPEAAALMALAEERPVGALRLELAPGSQFAGAWGGATQPHWRGRGLARALLARGAELAAQRGYRWLHADTVPESRRILLRLGFEELAKTTPYVLAASGPYSP